jgi:signal peptidase I
MVLGQGQAPGEDVPGAPTGTPHRGGRQKQTPSNRWVLELLGVIVAAVVVAVLLRTFVLATYSIPSASMEPTLQVGDRIVVDKLAYDFHGVGTGDIIVFATPPGEDCAGPPVANLVKRVIGLPGQTISLSDGRVYINGTVLPQSWLPATVQTETYAGPSSKPFALHQTYTVPKGDVFVMGDNRTDSCDSRYWGPVPESTIVGKVDVRIWPLSRVTFF